MKFRRSIMLVVVCAGLWLLAACSTGEGSGSNDSGSFKPVKIKHALGTAEITKQPKRVVTLGQGSAETSIALGVTPVGVEEYPWGADKSGYLPWIREAIEERGDKLPEQFTGGTELDVEAIVELEPDVILAPWSGLTQKQYDVLKDIAPTIAYEKQPWTITWQDQIDVISKALGYPDKSDELIDGIKEQFDEAAKPEYAKYSFSYIYTDGPGTLGVFYPDEQRVAFLTSLGLKASLSADDLTKYDAPGTDSALIGLENADMLDDADLLFTFYPDQKRRKEVEGQKLYAAIPAIKRGSLVAPTDTSFVTASSLINPLTVPWAIERYEPMIEKAIKAVGN